MGGGGGGGGGGEHIASNQRFEERSEIVESNYIPSHPQS